MLLTAACIPALPFFRREFGTSQADTTWLVTGFLLSSSVLTPLLGKLGDMYGKKRMLVCCLATGLIGYFIGQQREQRKRFYEVSAQLALKFFWRFKWSNAYA